MDAQILIVLAILSVTVFLLITEWVRIDVTALLSMLSLFWVGVISSEEALSGLSSNAVVAMIAVMILGEGIAKTGMMATFSKWALKRTGESRKGILGLLSVSVGTLSGIIQNIGAAALFLPGIMDISRRANIPAQSLVMPVGFAAIIGGSLTMVGSGHLILANDLLKSAGLEPYGLFAVTPVGIALLVAAILFFLFLGKFFLPDGSGQKKVETSEQEEIINAFQLHQNIHYYQIPEKSSLSGKTIEASGLWKTHSLNILALSEDKDIQYAPWRETILRGGHILALYGKEEDVQRFAAQYELDKAENPAMFETFSDAETMGFAEVIVPPRSGLAGQTIRDFSLRRKYAVEPVMLFSKGEKVVGDISDVQIEVGDTFIVYGSWKHIRALKNDSPMVVLTSERGTDYRSRKVRPAVLSFALAIALAMSGFSIPLAFLTGALAMILFKVISIQEAYQAIEWKIVFLLVGLIPMGLAIQNSGTAEFLATGVMNMLNDPPVLILLFTVGLLATVFSLVMSNVGAVVVLAPLVASIGTMAGIDPRPLVLLAAVCAGNSFILPTHQVNALMMSAGGYKTTDYFKAGGGITVVFLVVAVTFFYVLYF
ncbi:SLC13 family permease [Balneolaceae bacterium ANBcel3]|nr:SLC13 family permease [Balneolaceae bacterium ANBcel3]